MKKPYAGLQPGTEAWMACWRKHPELHQEMLEYKQRLEGENDMEHKKASTVVELEQVEQAVEEVEKILEEEDFEEIVAPKEEAKDKKEPKKEPKKKTAEQLKLIPTDHIVTVKDLAEELGTQPKALRKWLRKNAKKVSGRWEWEAGSPELEEIRAKYHREHEE